MFVYTYILFFAFKERMRTFVCIPLTCSFTKKNSPNECKSLSSSNLLCKSSVIIYFVCIMYIYVDSFENGKVVKMAAINPEFTLSSTPKVVLLTFKGQKKAIPYTGQVSKFEILGKISGFLNFDPCPLHKMGLFFWPLNIK